MINGDRNEQTKTAGMSFGLAIEKLKTGLMVARSGWNGKNMWIKLQQPDKHSKMTRPYIYMCPVDGRLIPWTASQADMLANDWMVIS